MRDEDEISCLPGGAVTAVPGSMVDEFVWIPCICDAEAKIAEKEEETFSIVIGDRINICYP